MQAAVGLLQAQELLIVSAYDAGGRGAMPPRPFFMSGFRGRAVPEKEPARDRFFRASATGGGKNGPASRCGASSFPGSFRQREGLHAFFPLAALSFTGEKSGGEFFVCGGRAEVCGLRGVTAGRAVYPRPARHAPVRLAGSCMTSHGVPCATMVPPFSPPPGPMSTT